MLLTYYHRTTNYINGNNYDLINWDEIERLVFVCKGNICRSPFAEIVARSLNLESFSCGVDTVEDSPANKDAVITAKELGYDLSGHRTRPIMYCDLYKTDLLIAMEPWHAQLVMENANLNYKVTLLGIWGTPGIPYIHDPFGTNKDYFKNCFQYIENTIHEISGKLKTKS